jgi:transaldolase
MVKIFCDSADLGQMAELLPKVQGYTTNPSLMRKAGVTNYRDFALTASKLGKPISFEVVADDFNEMGRQADILSKFGYVKIPITNTLGEPSDALIDLLVRRGVKVNVTAVMTLEQVERMIPLKPAIISIFAGRMADTGLDPHSLVYAAACLKTPCTEILWASTREVFNLLQATKARADIITMTPDLIKKLDMHGKDLNEYSLETVKMFYDDAQKAGYIL